MEFQLWTDPKRGRKEIFLLTPLKCFIFFRWFLMLRSGGKSDAAFLLVFRQCGQFLAEIGNGSAVFNSRSLRSMTWECFWMEHECTTQVSYPGWVKCIFLIFNTFTAFIYIFSPIVIFDRQNHNLKRGHSRAVSVCMFKMRGRGPGFKSRREVFSE